MMHFHIMTLFPDMVMAGLGTSITGRAIAKGLLSIEAVNIRDYAFNKHNSVDDYPYGGGAIISILSSVCRIILSFNHLNSMMDLLPHSYFSVLYNQNLQR